MIFPPRCAVCTEVLDMEERRGILCHDCAEQLPYVPKGICPHCGGVTETAGFCDFCLKEFAFESACAAFPYETVRRAIHLFKYDGGKKIGEGLGQLLADYMENTMKQYWQRRILCFPFPCTRRRKRNAASTRLTSSANSFRREQDFRFGGIFRCESGKRRRRVRWIPPSSGGRT